MEQIYQEIDHWDAVVIIRGGGATSDLSGFDTYELAAHCAQFPLPVITGIGHERDDTVLDMVSHTRVKTPTAAAEFLISRMREVAEELESYREQIRQGVPEQLEREKERLDRWVTRIPGKVLMRLQAEQFRQENLARRMQMAWQTRLVHEQYRLQLLQRLAQAVTARLQKEEHRLELLEQQVKAASPEVLLKKGYSITLKNGKAVTDASELQPGDEVQTRLAKGTVNSRILKIEN